jgi:tetratricopeptide (TPR) repeat protein
LAELHDLCGRYQEAETLYRQVLLREPRSFVALNNLAWLLIYERRQGEEALQLVNSAMEVKGPIPELLDTRAGAYLAMGQTDLAIADLNEALSQSSTSPDVRATIEFHLAKAWQRTGKKTDAENTLARAKAGGLDEKTLHPLEQAAFRKLATELRP